MLPYFFRHYDGFVDEYFVYDNGSTDASLSMLEAHGRVKVQHFDVSGDSFVDEERRLSDEIWKRSRGKADWVIVTDIDEHIQRPDMLAYLSRCQQEGITAIRSIGYEMVAAGFPPPEGKLVDLVTRGVRSVGHNRLCIFNPDSITATHYGPGRHKAWPEGHVVWPLSAEVLLLHYKQLGVDYVAARSAELAKGIKPGDLDQGWGAHYTWNLDEIRATWERMNAAAGPVPGLGELSHIAPIDYRGDEKAVELSGLLDPDWYMAAYPDLDANRADPSEALTHFCLYGWKEGRMPNLYFDPGWYLETHPDVAESGINPLIHYALTGERSGARPSLHFDPTWYRQQHNLEPDDSPLRHYLLRRYTGKLSPLPDFDVEAYCERNPEVRESSFDPYEHSLERAAVAADNAPRKPPTFGEIVATLGFDPAREIYPANVSWTQLLDVVKLFVRSIPVNEDAYRKAYPDVDEAIREGNLETARAHYIQHGFVEGRDAFGDHGLGD